MFGDTLTHFRRRLAGASPSTLNLYAIACAFVTYFCMYAFRKPFSAATYEGLTDPWGGELKTTLVISQIVGYAASKFLGIGIVSATTRRQRVALLVGLIVMAELALVLLALAPMDQPLLRVGAMFLNGLPLGMVWGLVILYLEGRQTSELMMAGLSSSYIVSSGIVKDVGRALIPGESIPLVGLSLPNPFPAMSEFWMPAATGLLFMPVFLVAVWLLDQLPDPNVQDQAERCERTAMQSSDRWLFLRTFWPGIVTALAAYFLITAHRDYRDNYMVDILAEMGYSYASDKTAISRTELWVAAGVLVIYGSLFKLRSNRLGLTALYVVIGSGLALMAGSTLLYQAKGINGFWWLTLLGLGGYLAYVPFGSMLFERILAQTRFVGTAVFGIYLADSIGYCGSISSQLVRDRLFSHFTRGEFLAGLALLTSALGLVLLGGSGWYFLASGPRSGHNSLTSAGKAP